MKYSVASSLESTAVGGLKAVRRTPFESHDEAVLKWYQQMRSTEVNIPGFTIKDAAVKIARKLGMEDFQASDGWLFRFCRQHGLHDKKAHG